MDSITGSFITVDKKAKINQCNIAIYSTVQTNSHHQSDLLRTIKKITH